MKNLYTLIRGIKPLKVIGNDDLSINEIHFDSRLIKPSDVFVALRGTQVDGHNFVETTIQNGAIAIICENLPDELHDHVTYIKVENSNEALAILSCNFYDNPSRKLKLVGITGTNGKTSTVTMLYNLFESLGYKAGLLSTINVKIHDKESTATHTTPDALAINKTINEMVEAGCDYCFMEVSSHALVQHRVTGLDFDIAIFSNITHDHLDYHHTFAEYIKAKKIFFDNLKPEAIAIINADDKNGGVMVQNCKAAIKNFSLNKLTDFKGKILENSFEGLNISINGTEVWIPLAGKFNAANILAVYSAAICLGAIETEILRVLSNIKTAEGRFDVVRSKNGLTAIIDYAHTPDALKNVLTTIADINEGGGRVITVVGAGGNRDKTKRPEMAQIASNLSDMIILTSDNPRFEEPEDIIRDMEAGIPIERRRKAMSIINRREAIKTAVNMASQGDVIMIAGKGHEKYQDVKGVKTHFDDKEIINELFN